jgi:phosphopantothenoylcysteine decarboxylase/phosphopantothenate--cysteine ligase
MGVAIAECAAGMGADVDLVLGPVDIRPQSENINVINVTGAAAMYEACVALFPACDMAVLAAAVADFTPVAVAGSKIKKGEGNISLELKPTADIAATLGKMKKQNQIIAGFALETDNELENAQRKLRHKNMDIIVLNSLNDEGAGFGYDTNRITIIDRNNVIDRFELKSKEEVAVDIFRKIISLINAKQILR